ncbi:MAG TPA: TonB-dependent receptor, partial [Thermoanaerobaculia bacterium]|nr:TonB-dependent receptor [Thermoanaerobaculia bacterium]
LEDYHYSGVITNNLLVEAQYSRRYFAFVGGGGPQGDLINGTLLRDNTTAQRLWSPTFCACDPKTRNNKDYLGKINYFISTKSMGSHNIIGGYDEFHELRHENNYQSGSNYRMWGDFSAAYPDGTVYFHADPVHGFVTINPIGQLSKTSDVQTQSVFVNDKWDLSNNFSFNIGARYDKDDALDQTHNKVASANAYSPRLGAIYDIKGNGRDRVSASYAKYVSHIDSGIADTVSVGGNPGSIYFNYRGPEINPLDPKTGQVIGTPVPTAQVIQKVFDWFNSVGGVNGYKDIFSISVPGLTAKLDPSGLKSPYMNETTLGYGHQLSAAGYLRADFIHRDWRNFYNEVLNISTGQNIAPNGSKVDVALVGNINGPFSRNYNGLQVQGSYRFFGRLNVGGNYTYSKLRGNVESETFNNATVFAGSPGSTTTFYPEYNAFARNNPSGNLNEDMRHRGNLYGSMDFRLPWGSLNVGAVERFHSGSPYSAVATIDPRPFVTNPGYATPPGSVNYYFSDRGAFHLPTVFATNLTATYTLPTFGKVNVFLRADLVNAFNQNKPEYVATGVGNVINLNVFTKKQRASSTDGLVQFAAFNPFTATPVQYIAGVSDPKAGPYNYQIDPNFGKPISPDSYGNASSLNPDQVPRTYRFAVGVRF